MDVRTTLAASEYAKARMVPEIDESTTSPAEALSRYAKDFTETLQRAENTSQDVLMGKADPHVLVEALAQSQLAVETAVTLRDKVVEAYQEILRMPV